MIGKPKPTKEPRKKKVPAATRRKRLVKALDEIVSQIVCYRDGGCVTPSPTCYGALTCSHYFKRENWGIRWDLENCNCQCQGHNNSHNNHDFPYGAYMKRKYGNDIGGRLLEREEQYRAGGKAGNKWTEVEMQAKLDELRGIMEQYQSRSLWVEKEK